MIEYETVRKHHRAIAILSRYMNELASAHFQKSAWLPALDDELKRAETLIVVDLGAIRRPDAQGQGSWFVESDRFQMPAGGRQHELRVLVTDSVLFQNGEFAVEDR